MAYRILGQDATGNPALDMAMQRIYNDYGDLVSVKDKMKTLRKFGRTNNADDSVKTEIAVLQGTTVIASLPASTNTITSVSFDNASDANKILTLEGHTVNASGEMTFVTQTVTLPSAITSTGTLTTALFRATRAFLKNSGTFGSPQSDLVGNVYFGTFSDAGVDGIPDTASQTTLLLPAGFNQTQNGSTSISNVDYWIITECSFGVRKESGPAAAVDCDLEFRDVANGGVWRPAGLEIELKSTGTTSTFLPLDPPIIIPKNHDTRMIAISDTADTGIQGYMAGYLAKVQTNIYDEG